MKEDISHAHGQLSALVCYVKAILLVSPQREAMQQFADRLIEQLVAGTLQSRADEAFLEGIESVRRDARDPFSPPPA